MLMPVAKPLHPARAGQRHTAAHAQLLVHSCLCTAARAQLHSRGSGTVPLFQRAQVALSPRAWHYSSPRNAALWSPQVWRVEKFEAVELAAHEYGTFSSGDCYIVLCTYGPKKSDYMMYMWQGAQSTQDERGACSLSAAKLDEELCNGSAVQVRAPRPRRPQAQYSSFVGSAFRRWHQATQAIYGPAAYHCRQALTQCTRCSVTLLISRAREVEC